MTANSHPVSTTIAKHLDSPQSSTIVANDLYVVPGVGVKAIYGNDEIRARKPRFTGTESHQSVAGLAEAE